MTSPTKMVWSPPSYWQCDLHSKVASASVRMGTPCRPWRQGTPLNLSSDGFENCKQTSACSLERILIAKLDADENAPKLKADRARHQSTSGGLNETELNELTDNPTGLPDSPNVVATTTPVAKHPSTLRSSCSSIELSAPLCSDFILSVLRSNCWRWRENRDLMTSKQIMILYGLHQIY